MIEKDWTSLSVKPVANHHSEMTMLASGGNQFSANFAFQ